MTVMIQMSGSGQNSLRVCRAPEGDGVADEMLQHLLADFHARHGLQLSLRWLYTLFVAHARAAAADLAARADRAALLASASGSPAREAPAEADLGGAVEEWAAAGLSGRSGGGVGLEGTQYEAVLLALLEGLRCERTGCFPACLVLKCVASGSPTCWTAARTPAYQPAPACFVSVTMRLHDSSRPFP